MLTAELEHLVIAKKEEVITNSTSLLAHPLVSNTKVVCFFFFLSYFQHLRTRGYQRGNVFRIVLV